MVWPSRPPPHVALPNPPRIRSAAPCSVAFLVGMALKGCYVGRERVAKERGVAPCSAAKHRAAIAASAAPPPHRAPKNVHHLPPGLMGQSTRGAARPRDTRRSPACLKSFFFIGQFVKRKAIPGIKPKGPEINEINEGSVDRYAWTVLPPPRGGG